MKIFWKICKKKMLTSVGHMCIIQHVSKRRAEETGCGSAWLERLVWDQEAAGSNPVTPIKIIKTPCGCSSMVEH